MAINNYYQGKGHEGLPIKASRNVPGYVETIKMSANTVQNIAIPSGASRVVIGKTGSGDLFVLFNNTSVQSDTIPPNASITDGTGLEVNPDPTTVFLCSGYTYIELAMTENGFVSLAFYKS